MTWTGFKVKLCYIQTHFANETKPINDEICFFLLELCYMFDSTYLALSRRREGNAYVKKKRYVIMKTWQIIVPFTDKKDR